MSKFYFNPEYVIESWLHLAQYFQVLPSKVQYDLFSFPPSCLSDSVLTHLSFLDCSYAAFQVVGSKGSHEAEDFFFCSNYKLSFNLKVQKKHLADLLTQLKLKESLIMHKESKLFAYVTTVPKC